SVVLPEPVAPTIPTRSPGRTSNVIPLRTQFGGVFTVEDAEEAEDAEDGSSLGAPLSYANQTSSNRMCPSAGAGRRVGCAGGAIAIGSSSSLKIRSDDAIADCRTLNFSDMSLIGRKKRCEYWMKATSAPSVSVPRRTFAPPYQMISAVASVLTNSIAG